MAEHGWDTGLGTAPTADPTQEFCRLACLTYSREDGPARWAQARHLLAEHPELTTADVWAAAAAARPGDVGRLLAERPARVAERGGPLRWRPLYYLVYSRCDPTMSAERVLAVARQLLDAGADPNDGYLFDALPTPFALLTGVFGHGELGRQRQPRHPHWRELGRLLLDAGADPNDAQTLYSAADGNVELTRRLLNLGADPNLRDHRFDATPLDWARHVHQLPTAALLEPVTAPPTTRA